MAKVIYNMVTDTDHYICPTGELLTDKELDRLFKNMPWRKPKTIKVRANRGDCYICFGARFILDGKLYEKI